MPAGSARPCGPRQDEGEKVQVIGVWDGPEEARRVGEEIETHPAPRRSPRRRRHPRPRPVPDPRVRGALHRHRPALPDRRRLPLLRARRDPRRPRLPPPHRPARRRPRLRADRQHAQARPRRQGGRDHPRATRARRSSRCSIAAAQILDTRRADARRPAAASATSSPTSPAGGTMADELPHPELARIMLDESGYTAMLQADRSRRERRPARKSRRARPRDGGI